MIIYCMSLFCFLFALSNKSTVTQAPSRDGCSAPQGLDGSADPPVPLPHVLNSTPWASACDRASHHIRLSLLPGRRIHESFLMICSCI